MGKTASNRRLPANSDGFLQLFGIFSLYYRFYYSGKNGIIITSWKKVSKVTGSIFFPFFLGERGEKHKQAQYPKSSLIPPPPLSTAPQWPIKDALHLNPTLKQRRRLLCERDEEAAAPPSEPISQKCNEWRRGDSAAHLLQITAGRKGVGGQLLTASPTWRKDFSSSAPWFPYLFLVFFCFHYSPEAWEGKTLTLWGNNGEKKRRKVELPVWSSAWVKQPSWGLRQPRGALQRQHARARSIRGKSVVGWVPKPPTYIS